MKTTSPPVINLNQQMLQLEIELNQAFLQRRKAIRYILICLLAAENGFVLGSPGTAKSEMLEAICKAFLGGKYFRTLMDRQMGKEDLGGAINVPDYIANGHWGRDITDTIADAHVALLDEAGNTGPLVMNMLLTCLNEKMYKPNGQWIDIPLISAFGASNYWLEDMPAAWDRFLVRFEVEYLIEDDDFEALFGRACSPDTRPQISTQIPLADLQDAIANGVPAVVIPPSLRNAVRQLRNDLKAAGIVVSDRRWAKCAKLIKASAYLNGRAVADEDDLQILQAVLWEQPSEQITVARMVMKLTSPVARAASEMATQLDSIAAEVELRRGTNIAERSAHGGTAQYEINVIQDRLDEVLKTATKEGRSTDALDAIAAQIRSTRALVFMVCMNLTPERAAAML